MHKYESGSSRLLLARQIAEEAVVLLKNEKECLPLPKGKAVAVLGRTQINTVIGGAGSGASYSKHALQITQELERAGLAVEPGLKEFYQRVRENEKEQEDSLQKTDIAGLVNSGLIYEIFGRYNGAKPEPLPPDALIMQAAKQVDTAVFVIGRMTGGEECDRRIEGDYTLTGSERQLVKLAASYFKRMIVVFNVNGPMDMAWMADYPQIQAALFMGSLGEQGAGALADILVGDVTPSGKLAQTFACRYEDYPTAEYMSYNKEEEAGIRTYEDYGLSPKENGSAGFALSPVTLYKEGIYVGYRYFDSFQRPVLYPFGYGVSYADFSWKCKKAALEDGKLLLSVAVTNDSRKYAGKEVLQAYLHAPEIRIEKPYQELKAVGKTKLLAPQETQELCLAIPIQEFASCDEERRIYVIEPGRYQILLGTSSQNTRCVAEVTVGNEITVRTLQARLKVTPVNKEKLSFLSRQTPYPQVPAPEEAFRLALCEKDLVLRERERENLDFETPAKSSVLRDVLEGRVSMEEFVGQMSVRELAVLCNGYGPGLPFGGIGSSCPSTILDEDKLPIGYNSHPTASPGYENPAIKKYGIYSTYYKDGPAGVGKVAWPTGMMLGCTFNRELLYEFGAACGYEAECLKVDAWLAPGINIMRNPLGGRVFEYFSEDPLWTGLCGIAVAKGAMENNRLTVCPKHFALNEQETYRRGNAKRNIDAVDSIAEERAVREIYLKPFEMVVTEAEPWVIMTSFNKVNGKFAAGNRELCTKILRDEWGYKGVVVTDWGDMDIVVDGADAVEAGNDVIMPGGPPVIKQVLSGYEDGRVSLQSLQRAAAHLMYYVMRTKSFKEGLVTDSDNKIPQAESDLSEKVFQE